MDIATIAVEGGLRYGPTTSGKMYLSMYKHRATRNPHKSFWNTDFKPAEEYALFARCDQESWIDCTRNYWGLVNGGKQELGALGERLGYFPANGVATAPWHGYPVSTADADYVVPESIIDAWIKNGEITGITAKRIRGGKL